MATHNVYMDSHNNGNSARKPIVISNRQFQNQSSGGPVVPQSNQNPYSTLRLSETTNIVDANHKTKDEQVNLTFRVY